MACTPKLPAPDTHKQTDVNDETYSKPEKGQRNRQFDLILAAPLHPGGQRAVVPHVQSDDGGQGRDGERRSDQRHDALQVQRQGLPDRLHGASQ